jgi:glutathione S-transferase
MRLFESRSAPNPRRVRVFVAEKGLPPIPSAELNIIAGEHLSENVAAVAPFGLLPVLELDDGTLISESIAICRYFDVLHPQPELFGRGALGVARVEMWNRLLEHEFFRHVANAFRHAHPAMRELEKPQIAELSATSKPRALGFLEKFDKELAGRKYAAGDAYSVADITGLCAFDFMKLARIACPPEFSNVWRWHAEISARPSASA